MVFKTIKQYFYSKQRKVFCIGANKTGTTSVERMFEQFGYKIGKQVEAERLIGDWANRDFEAIIKYVKFKGVAFQDIPFSLPDTYKIMDENFPDSKFILTVRTSSEEWYKSITSFHAKVFGNGNIPTAEDLKASEYVYKGWIWEAMQAIYKTPKDDIYNKAILTKQYEDYNASVISYFKDQPDKLLVINLLEKDAGLKISNFLGVKTKIETVPWKNKT